MSDVQNFKNHVRFVPLWHGGVFVGLLANFIWAAYRLYQAGLNGETTIAFVLAVALLLMFASTRIQILSVQDRIIRLEMRLRLAHVLPSEMHPHIATLTMPQLVALRFASDAELPVLVPDVLSGKLVSQKQIKMQVKDWQADVHRA